MKRKEKKKKERAYFPFHLSCASYLLLLLCLCIHILYNALLYYFLQTERINAALFHLQRADFIESQVLSLLITFISVLLLDLEIKRKQE